MRKKHWYQAGRTACRPETKDELKRDPAEKVTDVTCQPCIKALGLSPVVMRISAAEAKLTMRLPNGKRPELLVESFDLKVEAAPTVDLSNETTAQSFIGKKPEPIGLRVTLTENGFETLREAMFGR